MHPNRTLLKRVVCVTLVDEPIAATDEHDEVEVPDRESNERAKRVKNDSEELVGDPCTYGRVGARTSDEQMGGSTVTVSEDGTEGR